MTISSMTKLMLLWNILALMAGEGNALEVKMDPGMKKGEHSYIYCDVGTITAGVTFFTEPADIQGNCFAPGAPCSSPLYTLTQNTSGVLLKIASVDASREEGQWYCQHDTDRSSNTISLNDHTIAGTLLKANWTKPPGPVDTFSAEMTLSCTNQTPDVSFIFEDSESNNGTVPPEAVSMTTHSLYDGTSCENGNNFVVITMKASNNLDVFNNKTGVKFSFTYYGTMDDAPFGVDFLAFVQEPTTESPRTGRGCDGLCDWEIVIIVVVVVLVTLTVVIIIYCLKKKKKFCFKANENKATTGENTTTNNGVRNGTEYPIGLTSR